MNLKHERGNISTSTARNQKNQAAEKSGAPGGMIQAADQVAEVMSSSGPKQNTGSVQMFQCYEITGVLITVIRYHSGVSIKGSGRRINEGSLQAAAVCSGRDVRD